MLPEVIVGGCAAAIIYHHFVYPVALRLLAGRLSRKATAIAPAVRDEAALPRVAIIVPVHNEAAVIRRKIKNCAAIDYPHGKLEIIIACDGCSDATVALSEAALQELGQAGAAIRLIVRPRNQGKVAVLNDVIGGVDADIVALSDASAMLEADAIRRAVAHFSDPEVGVVCPTYKLAKAGSAGELAYWSYQTRLKADEATLGAPIGAHGAFYLFRRCEWTEIPADTINDDVIIPMRIVGAGYRAVYDCSIAATEIETTQATQEWRRRVRIGAGNLQQAIRLASLANPARPGLAFVFLSGKALRAVMPFVGVVAEVTIIVSAVNGNSVMSNLVYTQAAALAASLPTVTKHFIPLQRAAQWLDYLLQGYAAAFVGSVRYLLGFERGPWARAALAPVAVSSGSADAANGALTYVPWIVQIGKRILDIACALGALAVMIVLFVPLAIAIKLESRGPIFYRQLRVGRVTPTATHLFYLIKFRTMRSDAEAKSGAVWATKQDPRITRLGRFMRKTRLDELPQCINVLRGEMSVIGPRPERPSFFNTLEDAIPFYAERTYGLKPGITGLAQVNQDYDTCIEDVRNKVLYDHAYAARLTTPLSWLQTDFGILFKTISVMALGKGQ